MFLYFSMSMCSNISKNQERSSSCLLNIFKMNNDVLCCSCLRYDSVIMHFDCTKAFFQGLRSPLPVDLEDISCYTYLCFYAYISAGQKPRFCVMQKIQAVCTAEILMLKGESL